MLALLPLARRLLALPLLLVASLQPAPAAHPVMVQDQAAAYAPLNHARVLGGEAAESSAQLPQPDPAPRNRLRSRDGSLDVTVGVYSDCSGMAEVGHQGSFIDTCLRGRLYFIGHNPGPFTPLRAMAAGSLITYYDPAGLPHEWRIVETRTWSRWAGSPPLATPAVVAQFQTCVTLDGDWDEILDAEPAA